MKRACTLLLTLFLAACQTPVIADLLARPGDVLYQDDFSDPSSGWDILSETEGSLGYLDGAYHLQIATPDYDLLSVSHQVFTNARIEADMSRLAGPEDNRAGLVCRYRDVGHFYLFIISSDGYYALGKATDDSLVLLGQEMMEYTTAIRTRDVSNHLRMDCTGSTITGYVNGEMVAMAEDPDYTSGDAGLIVGAFDTAGVDVAFDNFVVYKP